MTWFFLVGFMCAGKTTLGKAVATQLSLPFFDLDRAVEQEAGASIPIIFETEGEESFRKRETKALLRTLEQQSKGVLASGGGAFTIEENRRVMMEAGISIWLDVPTDELLARVRGDRRPLWKNPEEARVLAEQRKAYYRLANLRLDLEGQSIEQNSTRLYRLLAPYRSDS
ncbi:MAG: shikimate kinase [Acidobacteria bacterium]|nr:MAG: shikimate kinase [Acidobacteriota bacterium]